MLATKFNSQEEIQKYYKIAYKMADDEQEDMVIVWQPREGLNYHPKLSYILPVSQADQWECDNGEIVKWRHQ